MRIRAAITALVLVAGCSPGITSTAPSGSLPVLPTSSSAAASASPPASGLPTSAPSPTPLPTPSPGPGGIALLAPGSAIEVTVAELNLREGPSTSAPRTEILKKGQVLIVSPYDGVWLGVGPVRKAYTWYPVMKLQTSDADGDLPALPTRPILVGTEVEVGWIATDDKETSFVKSLPPRCPATVDLANVEAMLAAERLACFGEPIVLEGIFGCDGCGGAFPGSFEPNWLADPQAYDFLSIDPSVQYGPLALRFPPGAPRPSLGEVIRVTVHVDDPAAASCQMSGIDTDGALVPISRATAILYCREQLVVDSYVVTGAAHDLGG